MIDWPLLQTPHNPTYASNPPAAHRHNRLREQFPPGSYHPVSKNCNHFSDALCKELVGAPIPTWINRPARIGGMFMFRGGGKGKGEKAGKAEKAAAAAATDKAARQKKELTEEQKKRLEAIRRAAGSS